MNKLGYQIMAAPLGKTHIFWVGQAGFVFKSKKGTILGLDMYLSDCVERFDGFKRLCPQLLMPEDIIFDYVVSSHWHLDHFDIDAMPLLMANRKTNLIAAADCKEQAEQLNLDKSRITYVLKGDKISCDDIELEAVFCDHGENTPLAVGFIITIDGKKIYFAGDTCLRLDMAPEIAEKGPFDVMIAPINGAFGNLNEEDAIKLCAFHNPKLFIPCHFWTFAEQYGNPGKLILDMKKELPEQKYILMTQGEQLVLE